MTSESVEIVEVGPRDGLQNEPTVLSVVDKVRYLRSLVEAGLRRIEAVSFVSPKRVPQMAEAESVMARAPRQPGVRYAALVLNQRGLDRALDAGMDEVNIVLVATDEFSRRNQGADLAASLAATDDLVSRARDRGTFVTLTVGAAFGCPFEGEVPVARIAEIARTCSSFGPDEFCLADTIGVGVPKDVTERADAVREWIDAPLRFHFHNTRNTGYANAIAAMAAGAAALDASSGGIGGCPFAPQATGNIATEDLVYLLERSGISTGLRLTDVLAPSALVGDLLGLRPEALLPRAGGFPPE